METALSFPVLSLKGKNQRNFKKTKRAKRPEKEGETPK